jgi:hypothetical protein
MKRTIALTFSWLALTISQATFAGGSETPAVVNAKGSSLVATKNLEQDSRDEETRNRRQRINVPTKKITVRWKSAAVKLPWAPFAPGD